MRSWSLTNQKPVEIATAAVDYAKKHFYDVLSAVMLLSVMVIPGLTTVFDVATLTAGQWLFVVASAFSIVPIVEIAKAIMRAMGMDKD